MLALALLVPAQGAAKPLDKVIPRLFGGTLNTTIDQSFSAVSQQQPSVIRRFRDLSAQLAAARSQVPLPSSSGAFSFAWDPEVDTFVRFEQSLGSIFAERAQTLGRGRFNIGMSYQRVEFSTLEGDSLSNIRSTQRAFTQAYLDNLPPDDQVIFGDDIVQTKLDMSFNFDLFYVSAAYGLTDNLDASLGLAVNRATMKGRALAMTVDPDGDGAGAFVANFTANQRGVITNGTGAVCGFPFRCAEDSFDESATGTGDIFVRLKWHADDFRYADLALAGVLTIPTGNADDFLGFHDPTFTPWLIASKNFGRFSPHVNLGYAIRSDEDVRQAQWIAGADFLGTRWLTLSADFLGYHDDIDDVIQSAIGFKLNPWGGLVLNAGFQFPVNRDGLRADVIYTGQIEYNF
ncbi:MAG: hypothetical protein AB7N53_06525 [Candidatus Binatia bacterium]